MVDLLDAPASEIRVTEGQLDLEHDLVVEGHPDTFAFTPLTPAEPGTMWAIDGGSCMLADGRSFTVAAFRAARVRFRDGITDLIDSPPLEVLALSRDEMQRIYRERLEAMEIEVPERVPDIPRPVDFLRECAEWQHVRATVREAASGDIVLVDGSLHGGPWVAASFVRDTHREAVERGVSLVGVVKASTLFWGRNAPLVTLLKRRGDRELGASTWTVRISTDPSFARLYVGDIFVAHMATTAPHAFRVDVARGPASADEVLARLVGAADDPAFVGYPYPLARAHQAARVSGYAVADLRIAFRDSLARHGMSDDDVETLFQDFHEILNRS